MEQGSGGELREAEEKRSTFNAELGEPIRNP